ncbi:MAG: hypothetical protein LBH20_12010 [Treponema sp.]|jgi:hypothetical protein|nr:hypothetical protein [Treponema sp.]
MEQEQTVSLTLPAQLNLFDMVSTPPYKDSPEYNEAYQKFQEEVKSEKATKRALIIISWLVLAAFLGYLYYTGHTFLIWVVGIIGVIICGIISAKNSPGSVNSHFDISEKNNELCKKIIEELIQNNFTEARYIYAWGKGFIYNNEVCAYLSVADELLVIYKLENLRQFSYEEVGYGEYGDIYGVTVPPGSERGGSTIGTVRYMGQGYKSKKIDIEITTNYIAYPIIRFSVPATGEYYEQLKIAHSILC